MKKTKKLEILYEDKELLVINKPSGLLTIATEKNTLHTLYHKAREYVKKQNPKNKIFIVHRLDKDTSGIVLFAKNEKIKKQLQENWNKETKREYLAIVEGKIDGHGTLKSYLWEDKNHLVHSGKKGVLALTQYEVLKNNKEYSLLKINILTGRKNQIRVQLSDIGHPIIGDKKYQSLKNPLGRLGLHAIYLKVQLKEKEYAWVSWVPLEFKKMFRQECESLEEMYGKITKNNSK